MRDFICPVIVQHIQVLQICITEAFAMGYQAVNDRPLADNWLDTIVIPNPGEEIEQNGNIVVWSLYASVPGTIFLQVFRPNQDNLNKYMLVDQLEFSPEAAGEYTIDMLSIDSPKWQGKGMGVKQGDVIGFYCPGQQVCICINSLYISSLNARYTGVFSMSRCWCMTRMRPWTRLH